MGMSALARRHTSTSPAVGLYTPPSEPPVKEEVKGLGKLQPDDFKIDEPFKGWQILKKPELLEKGLYIVELNSAHKELSIFNDSDKLSRLKYELNSLTSPNIRHIIIDFIHCHDNNNNINRTGEIADFLKGLRESFIKHGRGLSLAHLEGYLYRDTNLKSIDSFVHESVEDAIIDYKKEKPQLPVPNSEANIVKNNISHVPSYARPRLLVDNGTNPDNATEIQGNYLG